MVIKKVILFITINKMGGVYTNLSFKDLTTLKIGGKIALVYKPNSILNFLILSSYLRKENIKMIILGNGSNVLATDDYFDGVVVMFDKLPIKYVLIGNNLFVYPGVMLNKLAMFLSRKSFSGFSGLTGIPGTVGGALVTNAGSFDDSISNYVSKVLCLDEKGLISFKSAKRLEFSYRDSIFKREKLISLMIVFGLVKTDDNKKIMENINIYQNKRMLTQPLNKFNAGCTFKNPQNLSVGMLIEKEKLKGLKIGEAMISLKHGNFLINQGNATFEDMYTLINYVKNYIREKYQKNLELEWVIVNFKD